MYPCASSVNCENIFVNVINVTQKWVDLNHIASSPSVCQTLGKLRCFSLSSQQVNGSIFSFPLYDICIVFYLRNNLWGLKLIVDLSLITGSLWRRPRWNEDQYYFDDLWHNASVLMFMRNKSSAYGNSYENHIIFLIFNFRKMRMAKQNLRYSTPIKIMFTNRQTWRVCALQKQLVLSCMAAFLTWCIKLTV